MATDKDDGFARDFGYLIPFLDRVEAAGQQLTSPEAKEELARLLSGQKARWTRVRELLGTGEGSQSASAAKAASAADEAPAGVKAAPAVSAAPAASAVSAAPGPKARPRKLEAGFTVGALKHLRR